MRTLKVLFLLNLSIGLGVCMQTLQAKRNVLLIMADDFNYWTSKNGYYPQALTPNIDKLANKGVFFRQAHCSSPVCNPSRNAMWSGLRPSTTKIDDNSDGYVREKEGFENIVTMNQYFKEMGYYVYGSGKLWHPASMNANNLECDPKNWSQINSTKGGSEGGNLHKFKLTTKSNYQWSANPNEMTEENVGDYKLANSVAQFIQEYPKSENKNMPFFIGCGLFRPHMAWHSPVQFWNKFDESTFKKPAGVNEKVYAPNNNHQEILDHDKWMEGIHAYLACCNMSDYNTGIVLDAMFNSSMMDSTIILFMGDHGWHLGEKGRWGKYARWDESNHTTFIIYDPLAKGNGNECTKVVSLQDVFPTLIDLCGLPKRDNIEGRSIVSLLNEPNNKDWTHPVLMTYDGVDYIKTNQWRYESAGKESNLFNIVEDPYCWNNLIDKEELQPVIKRLQFQIDSMVAIGTKIKDKLIAETATYNGEHTNSATNNAHKTKAEHMSFLQNKLVENKTLHLNLLYSAPMVELCIYDLNGNCIVKNNVEGEIELDYPIDELNNGTYVLAIDSENNRIRQKFEIVN